ncbi:MAG: dATP/dGTP diphosphohydrolase domain-containing protein [Sphaerochaetaceae bacterium]
MLIDSGEKQEFDTGAVRDIQKGKGRCDLLPLDVIADYGHDPQLGFISRFQETGDARYLWEAFEYMVPILWGKTIETERIPNALLGVAIQFEDGAEKYGDNNWRKGIPASRYIDSAVRHYLKWLRGDKDEPHNRACVWNLLACMWTCKNKPELNDYAKTQ